MKFDTTYMNWRKVVISDAELSFYAKGIALYLNTFMNDSHNMAFPSLRRISDEMNVSRKTVIKYLAELVDSGYILKGEILSPFTQQHHNTYTAVVPDRMNPLKAGGGGTPPTAEVVDLRDEGGVSQGTKVVEEVHPNNQGNNQRNKQGRFAPPSAQEVQTYLDEKNIVTFTGEYFCDHYIARGWQLSNGVKVKDWKACVRTWLNRNRNDQPTEVDPLKGCI